MLNTYIAKLRELQELGIVISNVINNENVYDELMNMDMHIECAIDILSKEQV